MSVNIVLKNVRVSYPNLFHARAAVPGSDPKFSCAIIIRKDDPQAKTLKAALMKVASEKWPDKVKAGKWPSGIKNPLKDGDEDFDGRPEYEGCYVLNTNSSRRPLVIDRKKRPLAEEDDVIYAGCFCNFSLGVDSFEVPANKGVKAYLNGVQFVKDGDRLSGHDASGDFDDLDADETDDDGDLLF